MFDWTARQKVMPFMEIGRSFHVSGEEDVLTKPKVWELPQGTGVADDLGFL